MAHWPSGDLAVAYSARRPSPSNDAIGYAERSGGAWSSVATTAQLHLGGITTFQGLDLELDPGGEPALVSGLKNIVQVSRRVGGD